MPKITLADHLRSIQDLYVPKPAAPRPPVTEEALYDLVVKRARERAAAGCSTLSFAWEGVYSEDRDEWEAQRAIRERVAWRLRNEGLLVRTWPDYFAPGEWNDYYKEVDREVNGHNLDVCWRRGPEWFLITGESE